MKLPHRTNLVEFHEGRTGQLGAEPRSRRLRLWLLRGGFGEEEEQGLRSHFPPSDTLLPHLQTLASSRGARCSQQARCARKLSSSPHAPLVASSSCFCCAAVQKGQSHNSASPGCSASPMQSAWNHSVQRSQHTRKATRHRTPRRPLPSFMCGSPHKHPNRSCS